MSVEPGFGGQKFIPEVLPKVGTARRLVDSGELTIVVEYGGINEDTIEEAALAGVDCFVAGSRFTARRTRQPRWSRCAGRPRWPQSIFDYEP